MKKTLGFTLTEILIVVGLIVTLAAVTLPVTIDFLFRFTLIGETKVLESNLKSAQAKAMSAKNDSSFGVKFFATDICPLEDCYVVFQGSSYDTREVGEDEVFYLAKEILVEMAGDYTQIVFEKNTGLIEFK
jgi:type II secretory pathway pseudopilin PulG